MIPTPHTDSGEATPLLSSNALKGNTLFVYVVACLSAIGGFLFGYDTGIISGALIFIREVFHLNEWWQEAIVSSTLLAAWIFSLLACSATNTFGRKPVIVGSSLVFVAGSLLLAFAWSAGALLLGRLVVGAGVGLASMTVPMYIAEVAPAGIRGQLVMINMCCITGGQFFASLIAYWFSFIHGNDGWRYMLGFAALPAALQFFAFLAMPESPRWLMSRRRYEEAKRALRRIRPHGADIEAEFATIREHDLQARRAQETRNQQLSAHGEPELASTLRRILRTPAVRRALLVGCLLQAVQQVSGINTVMYYTASIFEMAGVRSKQRALLYSSGTALINFAFTLVGFALVERAGRRKLTLYSLLGVIASLLVLGASFHIAYVNSPKVSAWDHSAPNWPCDTVSDCAGCARLPQCGFCFGTGQNASAPDGTPLEASCLHVDAAHHDRSALGACAAGSSDASTWAFEWCPSAYSWLTMLGMALYLMFFAPGMGPMPWTINSEIYPSWARSWCLSAATSVNWLFNLLMSMTFLSLTQAITKHGAFYLYATLASAGFIYFALVLPETRGRSLEELEDLFLETDATKTRRANKNKEQQQSL